MDFKNSLNLPKTDFPMKAKLPEREPQQLAAWEEMRLYHRILDSRAGAPLFVLHDGPPYPTGEIHLGTGLNKVLKDMIVKSKTMAGFRSPYIPGWDCHGLPIETKVEKELGGKTTKVTAAEFRRMCREYAGRYVEATRRISSAWACLDSGKNPTSRWTRNMRRASPARLLTFWRRVTYTAG
jgi:isoleucyl-tRNA synthetase